MRNLISALALLLVHEWYDPACCSDKDCAPVMDMSRITRGEDGSYRVDGIMADRVLTSPDGEYHACVGRYLPIVFCIYVPTLA